jgi:hypothetical protein
MLQVVLWFHVTPIFKTPFLQLVPSSIYVESMIIVSTKSCITFWTFSLSCFISGFQTFQTEHMETFNCLADSSHVIRTAWLTVVMWSKLHVDSGHVIKTAWLTVFVWSKLADSSHVIRNAWLTVVMWSELSGWLYSCDQNCLVDSSHVIRTAFSIHGITCTMKIAIMIYVFFFPTHVLSINLISLIFHYFSMSKTLLIWQ